MNSRVGDSSDFIESDGDEIENLPLPDDYVPDSQLESRKPSDVNHILGHGKDLLQFCKSTGFRIMNGRWEDGNEIGKFTCIKSTGNSVADYCLIREQDRKLVNKFFVDNLTIYSDHTPLKLEINTIRVEDLNQEHESNSEEEYDISSTNKSEIDELRASYSFRYVAQEDYQQKIKECSSSEELIFEMDKLKSNILKDDITVTSAVEKLREIYIAISDRTFKRMSFEKNINSNERGRFCEWFDND